MADEIISRCHERGVRTAEAERRLAHQFRRHSVQRRYLAVAHGACAPRTFRSFLAPDRGDGLRGTWRGRGESPEGAKRAVTRIEVRERLNGATLVACALETGRTHQIRIHLAHIGCPVLCDRLYGGRARISELELIPRDKLGHDSGEQERAAAQMLLERQALHAERLTINHPTTSERMTFEAPLPADLQQILAALRRWRT